MVVKAAIVEEYRTEVGSFVFLSDGMVVSSLGSSLDNGDGSIEVNSLLCALCPASWTGGGSSDGSWDGEVSGIIGLCYFGCWLMEKLRKFHWYDYLVHILEMVEAPPVGCQMMELREAPLLVLWDVVSRDGVGSPCKRRCCQLCT